MAASGTMAANNYKRKKGCNMDKTGTEKEDRAMITVENLIKDFPGDVRAVDDISFRVEKGEIFGFLGPNGAGKTTTIRAIVTLLKPTSGKIPVDGFDVTKNPQAIRERDGSAAQFIGVAAALKAHEESVPQA